MPPHTRRRDASESSDVSDAEQPITVIQTSSAPPFRKLKGEENWSTWKMLMETHLSDYDDCLTTEISAAQQLDKKTPQYKMDQHCRKQLIYGMEEAVLVHVAGAKTAYQIWKGLCAAFEDKGPRRVSALLKQLVSLKQTGDLKDYVIHFKAAVQRLEEIGEAIANPQLLAIMLLENIKPEHRNFCQILEQTCEVVDRETNKATLSYDKVVDQLLREGIRLKTESGISNPALKAAPQQQQRQHPYTSAARGQHRGGPGGRGRGGGRGGQQSRGPWHHPPFTGPWPQQTTQPQQKQMQQQSPGSRQFNGPDRVQVRYPDGPFSACPHCNRRSHPEHACWYKPGRGGRPVNNDGENRKVQQQGGPNGPPKWVVAKIAKRGAVNVDNAESASKVLKVSDVECNSIKSIECYLDSGSFDNLMNDSSCIQGYRSIPKENIECAGDQILQTEGEGKFKLNPQKHGKLSEIQVKYCPGLSSNLLSVSTIPKSNLVTVFIDNYGGVFRKEDIIIKGKPLLKAMECNGTYKTNLEVAKNNVALKAMSSKSDDYKLWHKRYAHTGKNSLTQLKNGLVDGIPNNIIDDSDPCQICLESKQTRTPLPQGGVNKANDLLEIIHSDVCEVTDVTSWEGYRYFVTFIDSKSRYTMVGLLRKKDKVFEKFKSYKTLVEKHTGKQIKIMRSDNGGEYCNAEFDDYFKQEGILRQLSIPDTPEQNGVSERANRTLLEKVRALLKEAGLDLRYWAVALEMAVYLKNISPTKAVDGMVPFHAWTGLKPNVQNLKIFGCLASVHVSRKKSKKLGSRSRICVFMGYDEEKRGFKLMSLDQPHKYFVERSVVFDESRYPAKEIQSNVRIISPRENSENIPPYSEVVVSTFKNSRSKDNQSDTETYSTTSISRLSDDQQSNASRADSNSFADNMSSVSSEEDFINIGKRIRVPKQFPDFITYGLKRQSLLASNVRVPKNDGMDPNNYKNVHVPKYDLDPNNHKNVHVPDNDMDPDMNVPKTVKQALDSPEARFWIEAMIDELNSFECCKAWSLVITDEHVKIVGNRWVFKRKRNPDGSILYRARLVAKGYTQTYGEDYFEVYAPVVRRTTLRLLFSLAVNFELCIDHLDVKTAFLNGDLAETVYMAQPEGFIAEGYEGMVCKLNKAVYGLKQAARSWNLKADRVLKEQGFKNFHDEPCVYIKTSEGSIVIIALYVDDFYLLYNNKKDKIELFAVLSSHFKIKDLGELKDCLGMKLERDLENGTLLIHQEDYIESILSRFNMSDCNGASTPMENRLKLKDLKVGERTNFPYQQLIGCLLYLSVCTRPDISYTVSFLSQFNNCYTETHWNLALRVVAYLKATSRLGLKYVKSDNPSFCLMGYADADWAGNPADYRSYSGYCFTFDNNLISWESKKQKLTAQSSTESEYIAITEAVKESMFLNELVNNLFESGDQRITVFNDNTSAITTAYSSGFSARTKHFGCRIQLVRDCVQDGQVWLEHMSTKIMPADILTKPLERLKHQECSKNLRMSSD